MITLEEIFLILLGAGISFGSSFLLFFIQDWWKERENRKKAIKKLSVEIRTNQKNLDRFNMPLIKLRDKTIEQIITSGDINTLDHELIEKIINLYGKIGSYNQFVKSRSTDLLRSLKIESTMKNIIEILENKEEKLKEENEKRC